MRVSPEIVSLTYFTSRQPPQSREIRWNSSKIQRRAAPMPRVSDSVSDSVWRVPKPTRVRMSASIRAADGAVAMSCNCGTDAGGGAVVAAIAEAQQRLAAVASRYRCMATSPGCVEKCV